MNKLDPNTVDHTHDPSTIKTTLQIMPKCELHVHIEGTLEPELIFKLANRNQCTLPYTCVEELRQAYNFKDLPSFLKIYYAGASVLRHEEDFYEMAMEYFLQASKHHVVHVELFFDPQTHTSRQVPFKTIVQGLYQAQVDAKQKYALDSALIMCFLRDLGEKEAYTTWRQAENYLDYIVGIGLDSAELGHPPKAFENIYRECKSAGKHLVAHAGEEGPPSYIWSALDDLGVERIDHGVRAIEDPTLLRRLAKDQIPLTTCPLSNLKLGVVKKLSDLPLLTMLNQGLCVTINSDDPAYFGAYINDNFIQTFDALPLSAYHAYELAYNSIIASFVSMEKKVQWIEALNAIYATDA